jgi:hypothetical protein
MDRQQTNGIFEDSRLDLLECAPGRKAATFARVKEFIPAAVPEFQS